MYIGLILLGLIVGAIMGAGADELLGAFAGALLGFLVAHQVKLSRRLRNLETGYERKYRSAPAQTRPETASATPAGIRPAAEPAPFEAAATQSMTAVAADHGPDFGGFQPEPKTPSRSTWSKSPFDYSGYLTRIGNWFTTGNVPVKVGVLLSFIGVAFFLKYAIDKELLNLPIEFRLLAVAAGAVVMIFIGWRLRLKMRAYALSLQGGGIGILFLTIFAAFRIWQLVPAAPAFALLVALAALTGALSVWQKSKWLIILGSVGGFLAPVLTSTGQGSHIVLFSYYLLLNAAILGVSWFHAWRAVNLVGFIFTFVIGSIWGFSYYKPHLFASTEPFLVLHFLFYQAIAILYAMRQPPDRVGIVDGTLVFGTPAIAFALQAALVRNFEYGLAISAAVLAVFYALTANWLRRRPGGYLRVLSDAFIALAVVFATLTVPLALDARWTAGAWALEGAALIWIATRQPKHLANLAGAALIVMSGLSFMIHGWQHGSGWPVLNGNVLGGALISLSALFAAHRLENFELPPLSRVYQGIAWGLFGWGVLWLIATGFQEIEERLSGPQQFPAYLLFLTASTAGFAWLGTTRKWSMARMLTDMFLPVMGMLALTYTDTNRHYFEGLGWLAWPLAFALQAQLLRGMDRRRHDLAMTWHLLTVSLLTWLLMVDVAWYGRMGIAGAWGQALASAIPGIAALLIWRFRNRPWPIGVHAVAYRGLSLALVATQILYLLAVGIALPGDPGGVPYVPVFNPFDLAMLFCALTAVLSLTVLRRDTDILRDSPVSSWTTGYRTFLAAAFLVLTTAALLRGVHHIAGVHWDFQDLFASVIAQTSLSIYWGLLGFTGMVGGARRQNRWVWLGGAGFMALVVIKLFLVDLGNSGTIERIVSFMGIGALLLVVGYFAPAPPRQAES